LPQRQNTQDTTTQQLPSDLRLPNDFQDVLEVFVYTNLTLIMNPLNATALASTTTTTGTTTTITLPPGFTPELLTALQTAVLNHFTNLGLPADIEVLTREFFANLPPSTSTVTSLSPTPPITPITPTTPV
jgi:hypothetical protein